MAIKKETRVKFIAEVSSNHNGNLNRCLKFIDTAAKAGCDAVKFQLFKVDKLFAKQVLDVKEDLARRKSWELPGRFIPVLSEECHKNGMKFVCTPFYLEAVDELREYVDIFKIAAYDLLRLDLIKLCGASGLPVILSTGMATLQEVKNAVDVLKLEGAKDISLLHCVSSYPAPVKECNLSAIKTLKDAFDCKVGWSDHSVSDKVIYTAVYRWGADIIEFHLDLDGEGEEFSVGHCWLPDNIKTVITDIKNGIRRNMMEKSADGDGIKIPAKCEIKERKWRADPADGLRPMMEIRT